MFTTELPLAPSMSIDEEALHGEHGTLDVQAVLAMVRAFETDTDPFAELSPANLAPALVLTRSLMHREHMAKARLRAALRLQAFAQSEWNAQATALAGLTERVDVHDIDGRQFVVADAAVADIALATRTSEADVRRDLAIARTLETSLPETRAALASGQVNVGQAVALARAAERVPLGRREDLEAALLPMADTASAQVLRTRANAVVHTIDPDGDEQRRAKARQRRGVWLRDEEDGNTLLCARMATADAHACLRAIDTRARTHPVDAPGGLRRTFTTGQRLALALVDIVVGTRSTGDEPSARSAWQVAPDRADSATSAQGRPGDTARPSKTAPPRTDRGPRIDVAVTVDLPTLLGLRNEPIDINGVAKADIEQLRDLLERATDVRFRRLVLEPVTHRVMDVGDRVYRPPAHIERHVKARDGCCQWPGGCDVPADRCDVDHMTPHESGGATSADNLLTLCRWHHLLKTFHGYTPSRSGGDVDWGVLD